MKTSGKNENKSRQMTYTLDYVKLLSKIFLVIFTLSLLWFVRISCLKNHIDSQTGPYILNGLENVGKIGKIEVLSDGVRFSRRVKKKVIFGESNSENLYSIGALLKIKNHRLRLDCGEPELLGYIFLDDPLIRKHVNRLYIITDGEPPDEDAAWQSPLVISRQSLPESIRLGECEILAELSTSSGKNFSEISVNENLVIKPKIDNLFIINSITGEVDSLKKDVEKIVDDQTWIKYNNTSFQLHLTTLNQRIEKRLASNEWEYVSENRALRKLFNYDNHKYNLRLPDLTRVAIRNAIEVRTPPQQGGGWRLTNIETSKAWTLPFGEYVISGSDIKYKYLAPFNNWLVSKYKDKESAEIGKALLESNLTDKKNPYSLKMDDKTFYEQPVTIRNWIEKYNYTIHNAGVIPLINVRNEIKQSKSTFGIYNGWLCSIDIEDEENWTPCVKTNHGIWHPLLPDRSAPQKIYIKPNLSVEPNEYFEAKLIFNGNAKLFAGGEIIECKTYSDYLEFKTRQNQKWTPIFCLELEDEQFDWNSHIGIDIRFFEQENQLLEFREPEFWSWQSERELGWEKSDRELSNGMVALSDGKLWFSRDSARVKRETIRFLKSSPLNRRIDNLIIELSDFPGSGWLFIGERCKGKLNSGTNRIVCGPVSAGTRIGIEIILNNRKANRHINQLLEIRKGEVAGLSESSVELKIPAAIARDKKGERGSITASNDCLPWIKIEKGIRGLETGTVFFIQPTESGEHCFDLGYRLKETITFLEDGPEFLNEIGFDQAGLYIKLNGNNAKRRFSAEASENDGCIVNTRNGWLMANDANSKTRIGRYAFIDMKGERLYSIFVGGAHELDSPDNSIQFSYQTGKWKVRKNLLSEDCLINGVPIDSLNEDKYAIDETAGRYYKLNKYDIMEFANGLMIRLGGIDSNLAFDLADERRQMPGLELNGIIGNNSNNTGIEGVLNGILHDNEDAEIKTSIDPILQAIAYEETERIKQYYNKRDEFAQDTVRQMIDELKDYLDRNNLSDNGKYILEFVINKLTDELHALLEPRKASVAITDKAGKILAINGGLRLYSEQNAKEFYQNLFFEKKLDVHSPYPLTKTGPPGSVFKIVTTAGFLEARRGTIAGYPVFPELIANLPGLFSDTLMSGIRDIQDYVIFNRQFPIELQNFRREKIPDRGADLGDAFRHSYNTFFALGFILNKGFWDNDSFERNKDGFISNFWTRCYVNDRDAEAADLLLALAQKLRFNHSIDLLYDRSEIAKVFNVRVPGMINEHGKTSASRLAVEPAIYPRFHYPLVHSMPYCSIGQGMESATLMHISLITQMIMNSGEIAPPTIIASISDGRNVFKPKTSVEKIISWQTADNIAEFMRTTVQSGTAALVFSDYSDYLQENARAKTGTSETGKGRFQYPDGYFTCYLDSLDVTVCSFVSNSETGAKSAGSLTRRIMMKYLWLKHGIR